MGLGQEMVKITFFYGEFSLNSNFSVENEGGVELMEKGDWHHPGPFAISFRRK